jgi:hypothetical protein
LYTDPSVAGQAFDAQTAAMVTDPDSDTSAALTATYVMGTPSNLFSVLRRGQADASLVVCGDSTGNETNEWVYLAVLSIASEFPTHSVIYRLWNDGSQAYDSPVTVQTGSGARTLSVYNASVPGASAAYVYDESVVDTRLAAIMPVPPTQIILSYGYNWTAPEYRFEILKAVRAVRGRQPLADIILVSQPPRAVGADNEANNSARAADVRAVAAQERLGLIDAHQAFIDYGNYSADLISGVDGIHPTDLGQEVWVAEALKTLRGHPVRHHPRSASPGGDRVWIPATQFFASAGSPTLAIVANSVPTWALDKDTDEAVTATADVPSSWGRVNVYLVWFAAATSGSVVFVPRYGRLSSFDATSSGFYTAPAALGSTTIAASGTANAMRFTLVTNQNVAVPSASPGRLANGRPLIVSITRDADNVSDTMNGDAQFVGLLIERAE